MLERENYLKTITDFLSKLELEIRNRGYINLFDLNNVAESVFADLLNALYGYKLENLNKKGNTPGIDLGDKKQRVAFQITSTNSNSKIQKTIDKFIEYEQYKDYDSLNILIIGSKQKRYNSIQTKGINFSIEQNILDMRDIMHQSRARPTSNLKRVCTIIENEAPGILGRKRRSGRKVPRLLAEFTVDRKNRPLCDEGHYDIRLYVKDTPSGTRSVTYRLDQSFLQRNLTVEEGVPDFEEFITSYGDFEVEVVIGTRSSKKKISRWLSSALEEHYGNAANREVLKAIDRIIKR
jgi:hypothetical protein